MEREYYLGLDMGTSSVGWAVTDKNYNLLRAKGKDLWGVRLFPEANTAADRRNHRVARRRRQREKARIGYLKEMFAPEINKIDPGFFQRLEDSFYHIEDKRDKQPYALFADTGYTDKDYYEQYPTIFHLRKELIENKGEHDIRLVYLAILNMFKHRGHFLNTNLNGDGMEDIEELCGELIERLSEYGDIDIPVVGLANVVKEMLPSREYSNSRKADEILSRIQVTKSKNKPFTEIVKLLCGLSRKLSVVFVNEEFDEDGKKFAISFRDGNYEEKEITAEGILSDDAQEIFALLKRIHDWGILANIMKSGDKTYEYLSLARVELYEKHQKDLEILKSLFKKYEPQKYAEMFRVMADNNYSAYVGSVISSREKTRRGGKRAKAEFYANVKKIVSQMPESQEKDYVLSEIDKENFMPKQLTASNGVIPNQIHLAELKIILANAQEYIPFLSEVDDNGLSVSQKIIELFKFQIPYYVGPIFNDGKGNAWSKRKEEGKVYPWNFETKIDVKESAERFIEKMVNHCTYLNNETVLPKNSLLYEKFMVLNELNNLKINGESISCELKQQLYNDLFKKGKRVTGKTLVNYLKKNGIVDNDSTPEIAGVDGDFVNTLATYKKFTEVYGVETLSYEQEKMSENIIFWSTVYGDSKKFLREKIEEHYGDVVTKEQIKRIMGFKFKDWGRLSEQFLKMEGACIDLETGEIGEKRTIISRMWEDNENYNLMELLSKKFTYIDEVEKKTNKIEKTLMEICYEDLSELYISAPVKRMTWQTILIMKELYKVLGCEPTKVFVEMARDAETVKERKDSRKKKFAELYKGCKEDGVNWSDEIAKRPESDFRSKKLYLYYTQKGKCMYTGEKIDLYTLMNDNNAYDIDHIYPRHYVKDDSIENNLVLVKKEKNAHKSDTFPIEADIRREQHIMWRMLRDGKFITEEKYKRLTRNDEFSDDERAGFISRQIVETRQATKTIAHLFEKSFDKTRVVYVKAGNVSQFRQKYKMIKCREINDFHHANDAYLNIVVGNVYDVKFTSNPIRFIKEWRKDRTKNEYHMYKVFDFPVARGNEIAWDTQDEASLSIVKKVMRKNTPLVTRMNYEVHGKIAEQTIYSAKKARESKENVYLSIKSMNDVLDTKKYGGYSSLTGTYFFVVEHTKKGKRVRSIEDMPLFYSRKIKSVKDIEEYCKQYLGYEEPIIKVNKIKRYSKISLEGAIYYLASRADDTRFVLVNAMQLIMSSYDQEYIKEVCNYYNGNRNENSKVTVKNNIELYMKLAKKHNETIYSKRNNSIGKKLDDGLTIFRELDIEKQVYVLIQILQSTSFSTLGSDLRLIGESKGTGKMKMSKYITGKKVSLINQSITGLYENEIDLLKV